MIICGYNSITEKLKGIIIDPDAPEGDRFIRGSPMDERVLREAGIENENVMVITTDDDNTNIFLVLLAKKLNPKIKIGVIIRKMENVEKCHRSGADYVILESEILGKEILNSLLSPRVANLMDRIIISQDLQIFSLTLPREYWGKKIRDTDIRSRMGTIIGIKRGKKIIKNPEPNFMLKKGDKLIFFGGEKEINRMKEIMAQWISQKE